MSEAKPLKRAELARHWKVSGAYVTKLGRPIGEGGKAMPEFFSLASADEWRAMNAPGRPALETARLSTTTTPEPTQKPRAVSAPQPADVPAAAPAAPTVPERIIDVTEFVNHQADFTNLMIAQAKVVPQVAHGLWLDACKRFKHAEIDRTLSTWTDAAKASGEILSRFLELQERAGTLVPIDVVMDIVGTELQQVRNRLVKFGERIGPRANPDNPILAVNVINAEVDDIFRAIEHAANISPAELVAS